MSDSAHHVEEVWFGYHPDDGWIAMDRLLPENSGSSTVKLVFLRDLTRREMPRREWNKRYRHWEATIESVPPERRDAIISEFNYVRDTYWKSRMTFIQAWKTELRARANGVDAHVAEALQLTSTTGDGSRVTHCWKCHATLGRDEHVVFCPKCSWILCDCGGCGCGFYQYASG